MWIVTLTVQPHMEAEPSDHEVKIYSNRVEDLFSNEHFRWKVLQRLMDNGTLLRIAIDFKPSLNGVKRIEKDDRGLYYLTIDRVRVSRAYTERGDAWALV